MTIHGKTGYKRNTMGKTKKDKRAYLQKESLLPDTELYCAVGSKGKTYKSTAGLNTGITKLGKLIAKNANRSIKKRFRQECKLELLNFEHK